MPRSNLLPKAFNLDFLKTVEAKVIILTNLTMAINKFQRSRLTFQPRSLILEFHQYIKTLRKHMAN